MFCTRVTAAAGLLWLRGVNGEQTRLYFLFQTTSAPFKAVALNLGCTLELPEKFEQQLLAEFHSSGILISLVLVADWSQPASTQEG